MIMINEFGENKNLIKKKQCEPSMKEFQLYYNSIYNFMCLINESHSSILFCFYEN